MTVKTEDFRGDIYKNDKNAELRCSPEPIHYVKYFECFYLCPMRDKNLGVARAKIFVTKQQRFSTYIKYSSNCKSDLSGLG